MKTLIAIACFGLLAISSPVLAATDQDVQSDAAAVQKDNQALSQDDATLARNRAEKAAAEANGDAGAQAVDSAKIGATQAAIAEKQTEKDADKKILNHDEQNDQ